MPSPKGYFKTVKKTCNICGKPLVLKNSRDIERKKFCSATCRGKSVYDSIKLTEKSCVKCNTKFTSKTNNQKYCSYECSSSYQVVRSYKMLHNNPEKYLQHALYKKGREALSVEFMLEVYEQQGGLCAITGKKLTFIKKPGNGRVNTNASIDQIEAGGGYTEDNVQLVCDIVNRMKSDMDMQELRFWCRAILED